MHERVAARYLKKAGNEYRLSVICSNHKRELHQLVGPLKRKIEEFNRDFRQDARGLDVDVPNLDMTALLLSGDNMAPVKALATYVEILGDAEVELLKAAGLD